MSRILALIISVCASLVAACASISAGAPPNSAVVAATAIELDAANAAFSAAWVAGDVDALTAAYTLDAVVHPPAGGIVTTPEQIRSVWAPIVNQSRVGHRLEATLRQSLSGGEILEMGRWHAARANDQGAEVWTTGCYTVIWRNDEGRWRMRYDGWSGVNEQSWACRPR